MSAAAAIAVSILVSTGPGRLSSGDGALEIELPAGYSPRQTAPAAGDFDLTDSSGNALTLRRQPPEAGRVWLEAAAYDAVKELELRLSEGQACAAGPLREISLRRGGFVRGLEGRCGEGLQAREYGVLISTQLGLPLLAAASGRVAPLLDLMEGARASLVPTELSPPGPPGKGPLAPLPPRPFHGKFALLLLAAFGAVQGAALAARALGLNRPPPPPPPAPASPPSFFPAKIERIHLQSRIVFEAAGANGEDLSAVSDRKASMVIGFGMGLFLLAGLQASFRADSGTIIETLVLSCLALGMGAFLQKSSPRALTLFDGEGNALLEVAEEGYSPLEPRATAVDKEGWHHFRLRRLRAGRLRRWEVLDPVQDTVLLEVAEKASYKTWLRPWTGHLWGLLRADYSLLAQGREVGSLDHEPTMGNRARLAASPTPGLSPRALLAAVLFIERVDPDRWHPWPA